MKSSGVLSLILLIGVISMVWMIRRSEVGVRKQLSEPGEYRVVLQVTGPRSIGVMKEIKRATGVPLRGTRHLVESTPSIVIEGISRSSADAAVARLEQLGARAVAVRMEELGADSEWPPDPAGPDPDLV